MLLVFQSVGSGLSDLGAGVAIAGMAIGVGLWKIGSW